jgi:hypothetical protein
MDGGSSLNILYAHTLRLLGIGLDQLRPSTTPFHGVVSGKRVQPLGQIDLPVWFGTPDNFRKETLTFEGGGVQGCVPRHSRAAVLRQVHGSPELHLPQDEDAGAQRRHHRSSTHLTAMLSAWSTLRR